MPASVERRPTGKATCHGGAIASGLSTSLDVVENSPICARSLAVVDLEIARAAAEPKSVPPLNRAKRVKFVLSRLGITVSFLLA